MTSLCLLRFIMGNTGAVKGLSVVIVVAAGICYFLKLNFRSVLQ